MASLSFDSLDCADAAGAFKATAGRGTDNCDVGDVLLGLSRNFTLFNASSPYGVINDWGSEALKVWSENPRVESFVLEQSADGGKWVLSRLPDIAQKMGPIAAENMDTEDVLQGLGLGGRTGISYFRTNNEDDNGGSDDDSTAGGSGGGGGGGQDDSTAGGGGGGGGGGSGGGVRIVEYAGKASYAFSDVFPTVQSVIVALANLKDLEGGGRNVRDVTLLELAQNTLERGYATSREALEANNATSCRDDVYVGDLLEVDGFGENLSGFKNEKNETLEEYLQTLDPVATAGDTVVGNSPSATNGGGKGGKGVGDVAEPDSVGGANRTDAADFLEENRNLTTCEFFEKYNASAGEAFSAFRNADYNISFGDVVETVYFGGVVSGRVPYVGGVVPDVSTPNRPDAPNIGGAVLPAIPGIGNVPVIDESDGDGSGDGGGGGGGGGGGSGTGGGGVTDRPTLGNVWYWLGDRAEAPPTPSVGGGGVGVPFALSLEDVQDFTTPDTSAAPVDATSSTGELLRATQQTLVGDEVSLTLTPPPSTLNPEP